MPQLFRYFGRSSNHKADHKKRYQNNVRVINASTETEAHARDPSARNLTTVVKVGQDKDAYYTD